MNVGSKELQIRDVFAHKLCLQVIILIFIHQAIIASSAIFLTETIEAFQNGSPVTPHLLIYFLTMTAPFIPGCLSYYALKKWENKSHRIFTEKISVALTNRLDLHRNRELQDLVVGLASRNSFAIISSVTTYFHGILTFLLNSVLSMVVIALIIPTEIAFGYVLSGVGSLMIIWLVSPIIARKTETVESLSVRYGTLLSKIWPSLTLGNEYNIKLWSNSLEKQRGNYYKASEDLAKFRQMNNIVLGLIALIPTMYLIYSTISHSAASSAVVAAIVVNLTRILHVLNSLSALIYQGLDAKGVIARFNVLRHAFSLISQPGEQLAEIVVPCESQLRVNGEALAQYGGISAFLNSSSSGRFTITGPNGSGKSTFLLYLKYLYGANAFLLPAHFTSMQWHDDTSRASTGEALLIAIKEAVKLEKIKYFLLDEWDANLDFANRTIIEGLLADLADKVVVIDVRHGNV